MALKVDLKPKKELINPQFDSYKLSLDPLPTYHQELEKAIDVCSLTQDQLTLHHTKLFAAPNHLIPDPWAENSVYLVDRDWAVRNVFICESGKVECGCQVFEIPESSEYHHVPGRLNVSLCFASPHHAVLADGAGRLFLIDTGDRKHRSAKWKILLTEKVLKDDIAFSVVDATQHTNSSTTVGGDAGVRVEAVECLLASVEKDESSNHNLTVLTWLTLSTGADQKWTVVRKRRLEGRQPFEHASLERNGTAVTIASNCPFTMTADSVKEITLSSEAGEEWEVVGREPRQPMYTWSQTAEDITIQLTLPADTAKADVYVSLANDQIDIGIKNNVTLLGGPLRERIDITTGTWSVNDQRLEVCVMKEKEEIWDMLVVGDTRGEMTMDEATITAIHERLKHLTSDKWNPDPDPQNKPFNTQQLEACDDVDDEECIFLTRIDGETHCISHQATVSYNLLFNVRLDPNLGAALCLRHDVDGFVWQPEIAGDPAGGPSSKSCPWRHAGTLDAFGYVQASKAQRRFSSCAPDFSLAAIADCSRHVYLYRQRAPTATPLRNRRTGKSVSCVAKQHVVALDPPDPILGLHVSNDHVFVATASRIYAVSVSQEA
ncbi:hypothetical protein BaRGS_00009905 [Batillaria attramentaria]|uniref:NudC domain-containing protein 1 n=1 Tax=Batillaria attramentaria TaxID=370345 RepID=A0ABD0LI91_9CAEN